MPRMTNVPERAQPRLDMQDWAAGGDAVTGSVGPPKSVRMMGW